MHPQVPGLAAVQATHLLSSALFCTIHVSHSHAPSGFLNLSPKPLIVETGSEGVDVVLAAEKAGGKVNEGLSPVPGLAVSQATHFTASGLLDTRHVSHSHVPTGLEKMGQNPVVVRVVEPMLVLLLCCPAELADFLLSADLGEEFSFGASLLQFIEALYKLPNPAEGGGKEEELVLDVGVVLDRLDVFWGSALAPGEFLTTGEAKPGGNKDNFLKTDYHNR